MDDAIIKRFMEIAKDFPECGMVVGIKNKDDDKVWCWSNLLNPKEPFRALLDTDWQEGVLNDSDV